MAQALVDAGKNILSSIYGMEKELCVERGKEVEVVKQKEDMTGDDSRCHWSGKINISTSCLSCSHECQASLC